MWGSLRAEELSEPPHALGEERLRRMTRRHLEQAVPRLRVMLMGPHAVMVDFALSPPHRLVVADGVVGVPMPLHVRAGISKRIAAPAHGVSFWASISTSM